MFKYFENYFDIDRKVWQIIWDAIMSPRGFGWGGNDFENEVFQVRMYRWNDIEDDPDNHNNYHFWHKPSGFKIEWYKYPLRGAYCNMDISDGQFVDVLYDCVNSIERENAVSVIHDLTEWWIDGKNISERIIGDE